MKIAKKKASFGNCSACQNGLYSVDAVRLSAACAEIIAAVWGLFSFGMRGGWLQLLWVLLSCLRQKLRHHHGVGDGTFMDLLSNESVCTHIGGL